MTTNNQEGHNSNTQKKEEKNTLSQITMSYGVEIAKRTSRMRQIPLDLLVGEISTSLDLRTKIETIRLEKDLRRRDWLKKQLPYFSFGTFGSNYLNKKNFEKTKYLQFDADDLDGRLSSIRQQLCSDSTIFTLFDSPSGTGLKFSIELDEEVTSLERHEELHRHYSEEFEKCYNIVIDPSTHGAQCACFMSYDPDIYVNTNNQVVSASVEVSEEIKRKSKHKRKEVLTAINDAKEGTRNNSVVSIAGTLYARKFDYDFSLGLLQKWNKGCDNPLPEEEIIRTIKHVHTDYRACIDYSQDFTLIHEGLKIQKVEDVTIGQEFFIWLQKNRQAQFFTDERGSHYVYLDKKLILLDRDSSECQVLLLNQANISTEKMKGRVVCQVLNAKAHIEGTRINRDTWLHTDLEKLAVYINLKNQSNELVKISPDGVAVIQNGQNDDNVFMLNLAEDKLQPIEYKELTDDKIKQVFEFVEQKIIKHIPSPEEDKWISYAWRMSYPLFDFTKAHLILRFQGDMSSGKTTASRLLSYSLYGEDYTDKATVASMYSDASVNPLVLDDNLEAKAFYADPGRSDFYLGVATGGGRQKREKNTDSGLVIEKSRALVICNGIESIAKSEHTSRMMIVPCDRVTYASDYTSAVLLELKRNRNDILSGEFMITQKVLKRIENGDWGKAQKRLIAEFSNHPKNRMFEHLGIIILYLEELWTVLGKTGDTWEVVKKWMDKQKETSEQEIIGTDPIIQALEILRVSAVKQKELERKLIPGNAVDAIEMQKQITLNIKALLIDISVDETSFLCKGTAGDLMSAFSTAYQVHLKKQFPFERSKVLSQRISTIHNELIAAGYTFKVEEDKHLKQNRYEFEKEI